MTAINMCTIFNNCSCGINNMFMSFNSFSFNNFFSAPIFNPFSTFTPNFFSFIPQTPIFQMPAMNFSPPGSTWDNLNTTNVWAQTPINFSPPTFNRNNMSTTNIWSQMPMNYSYNSTIGDSYFRTTTAPVTRKTGSLQSQLADKALSYVGKVNSDAEGNRLFSNGRKNEWCADFASTLVYSTFGNNIPSDFPDAKKHGIASKSLMEWAKKPQNNCFLQKPSSNVKGWIAQNVKAGDIMILDRGGAKGHTAIVTKVYSDGTMDIVEGNVDGSKYNGGRVALRTRKAPPDNLLGFVSLDKFSS